MSYVHPEQYARMQQTNFDFIHKCKYGSVKEVYDVLFRKPVYAHDISTQNMDLNIQDGFSAACKNGNLAVVKELVYRPGFRGSIMSEGLVHPATVNGSDSAGMEGLSAAAFGGKLEVVGFLLNKENIKNYRNLEKSVKDAFLFACIGGHVEAVDYFLTNSITKKHININEQNNYQYDAFLTSCKQGNLAVVKYLLTSDKIEEHANINAQNSEGENGAVLVAKKIQSDTFHNNHIKRESELTKKPSFNYLKTEKSEELLVYLLKNKEFNVFERTKEKITDALKDCPDTLMAASMLMDSKLTPPTVKVPVINKTASFKKKSHKIA